MVQQAIAIIPARAGSTRLPEKVLLAETGMPLIRHVVDAARGAACVSRLVVATDDPRVMHAVRQFGGECVMTRVDHPNGTSRLNEACHALGIRDPGAIIVNVQGDEPELDPALIDAAVETLVRAGPAVEVATVACPFESGEDPANPNLVKVVRRIDGTALYFSRSRIPFDRDGSAGDAARPLRHIGLYVYRRGFLERYVNMPPTPLEHSEKLEQLRMLEHGAAIAVAVAKPRWGGAGIDTREQYDAFVERYRRRAGS